jgi:hypothetical protein
MMPDELQVDALTPTPPAQGRDESNDTAITEDLALAQLKDPDLNSHAVEQIGRNASAMKSRKVRMAMASHLRTPRRIALRIIRELYTFELMQFALRPGAAADLKRIADELLLSRLPSITLGERISLARRSSTLVAAGLLLDREPRVWQLALENARLTEAAIVKALQRPTGTRTFVEAVSHHPKWSVRHEVQVALLRNAHTPQARALEFARRIPPRLLRDILHASRLPERIKSQLRKEREVSD